MSLLPKLSFGPIRKSPKIVKVLMAQQFLEGFVPIAALYTIMFERVGGLSFEQIGILFSLWALAYLVAELPSGVLADYWSRRNVIILGGVLRCIGFAVWILWPTFAGFAIGFALWGLMIACSSGALSAYLLEELKAMGKSKLFARYFGWVMSALWLGMLAAYLTAAVFTLQFTNVLIGLSVASSLLFSLVLLMTPEHPYKRQATYIKTLKAGFVEVSRSKKLRYLCFGLASVYLIVGVLEELLPRIFAQFGLNDHGVSVVLASSLIVTVVLMTRLEAFVRFSLSKQMLVMCAGMLCWLAGLYLGGLSGVALVLAFSLIFHLFRPVFIHHVQDAAEGDERATVVSIPGLASGLLNIVAYLVIAKVAGLTSEKVSLMLYGAFWLGVLLLLALWGRRYGIKGASEHEASETGQPSTQF